MDTTKQIAVDEYATARMARRAILAEVVASAARHAGQSLFSTSDKSSRKKDRKARMRELQRKAFLGK